MSAIEDKKSIKSANFHVCGVCNYRCEHCFDRCLVHEHMTPDEWQSRLDFAKQVGVTKINFAGGEPTLYPHLKELATRAKAMGFTTSIVSNGSRIDEQWIIEFHEVIDWIGLSIDSPSEEDEVLIGRHYRGLNHLDHVKRVAELARAFGMKVKLNITIVKKSCTKDFHDFIRQINPDRIKAFRALTLKNANDDIPDVWSITDEEYEAFKKRHEDLDIVFEDTDDIIDSYLMFDPLGRWMIDHDGVKSFRPFEDLLENGMESILDVDKYYNRKGFYDW